MDIREVETAVVYKDESQACNQGSIIQLADGDMLMAFNQDGAASTPTAVSPASFVH